jgi:cyclopropane-fatty-acyl-phospholipid synthase
VISHIRTGTLTLILPNGRTRVYTGGKEGPAATLIVSDLKFFYSIIFKGEIGFGEAYADGLCSTPDLVSLIQLAIINRQAADFNRGPLQIISGFVNRHFHLRNKNTLSKARENIHAHYDLGNQFFQTFLDESMTYSSAVFDDPDQSLVDAQMNKYRILCEAIHLSPTDHVLEIGSGWGSFAVFAAKNFGCKVTSITISSEQFELARKRVRDADLASKVAIHLCDYRDIEGHFTKIVSIEMFEAVGAEFFDQFFAKCSEILASDGQMAMQVITVPDKSFDSQLHGVNWIQKYIFPGGVLPSQGIMKESSKRAGLSMAIIGEIGSHYATTLHIWRARFWEQIEIIRSLGYDDHFINIWDYYLGVCEAGFITGNTGDAHLLFTKDKIS